MKVVKITFDHREGDLVFFKTESRELISLPVKFLPRDFDIKEGTTLYLTLQKNLTSSENQKHLAKVLLEEILNGGE
jgi:hypothetical protein